MQQTNPYSKMRENAIMTAPKEELTLMLYDGALKFINQAQIAMENKDPGKTHECLVRVQDIIREFQITLDRKHEVSQHFDIMYEYIFRRLVEANTKKDIEAVKECSELIRGMRDIWKEAMQVARGAKAAQPGAPAATGKSLQG
ncbi:MAG: flagellar export chaperone FliS [Defluviitaleaceae bacterium]|nr:flagellar export chaperone FliS [Defluviitaleaceae bacterium]